MGLPPSRGAEQLSFVLRTSDPSANAAEAAAKNDRVGLVKVESLNADVDGNMLLHVARSQVSASNDHENMLWTRVWKCWKLKEGWRARTSPTESRSCFCTSVDCGSRATS